MPLQIDSVTSEGLLSHVSKVAVPATQATAVGTLTLVVGSNMAQYFTGTTAGQIIKLPDATTLAIGQRYEFFNQSTQTIAVNDGSGAPLFTLSQTSVAYVTLQANSTAAGGWIAWQAFASATGVQNYQIVSSTTFASSSTTDVVITGFTVTPQTGTYAVWFNLSSQNSSGTASNFASIYRAAAQIADSERRVGFGAANVPAALASMSVIAFNGSQACDVRVRVTAATGTTNARTLLLIRLGS